MDKLDGRKAMVLNGIVLAMAGVAVGGAALMVPPTASGGIDAVGIAATAEAIMLAGVGTALAGTSSLRVPRFGEGSLTRDGIATRSLAIVAVALALAAMTLAARPVLPRDLVMLVPLGAYGLACLSAVVGMAQSVTEGSDPRTRGVPAGTER